MKKSFKQAVLTVFTLMATAVTWADVVYTNSLAGYDYSLEVNDVVYAATQTRALTTLAEADGNNFDRVVYQDSVDNDVRTHTFSMWVKVDSLVDDQLLWWVCGGRNGEHSGYAVKAMADGKIRIGKANANGSWNGGNYNTRNFGFAAGSWTHITVVVVKRETERVADVTAYKDGVAIAETFSFPTNLNGTGGSTTFVQVGANISVAGARVYDEALTAEQVAAIDRTADLVAAPEATIATVDAETVNASELVWSNGEPSEENRAVITAEVPATLTMDGAIVANELAIEGEKVTFSGSEILSSGMTKITADTDVSGITAGLGDILIAAGKTLTIGPNYSGTFMKGEILGTINVRGGTPEAPVVVNNGTAVNENLGAITVEADSVLQLYATGGNKVYKVTGSGASSRVRVTSNRDWGVTVSGSKIANCTLEIPQYVTGTTANANFWLTPATLGEDVHLVIDENRQLKFENSGSPLFASLSGRGNIAANGSYTITIENESEAEYAGVIAGSHAIVKRGNGTQIFSGANTYSGTTQIQEGVLKIAANGSVGTGGVSIAEGATLEWASTADKTLPASLFGDGTLKTVTNQVYYVSGALPKHVELSRGTLNLGTARFPQTVVALSEDGAANATLAITLTAEEVAAGYVEICQISGDDGDALPEGLTIAITPGSGVNEALTDWSLRVVGGRLIYALPAVTHQWVAGATDWAAGVPDFKQGDSIVFGETEAKTSITFPQGLVAGEITIAGDYTSPNLGTPLSADRITVEEGATLNLGVPQQAKYLRLSVSNVNSGDHFALAELILTKDGTPVAWPLGTTIYQLNADGTQTEPDWAATGNESVNALIDTVYLGSGNGRVYTNPETGETGEYPNESYIINRNKWITLSQSNIYAVITLGEAITFDGYRLMTADHHPRSPKDWTLEISNDGVTWSVADQQVNHATPTTNAFYVYDSETGSTTFPTEDTFTVDASITVRGELTGEATIAGDVIIAEGGAIVVDGEQYLTIEGELSGAVKFVVPTGTILTPLVKIDAENVKSVPTIVDADGGDFAYAFELIGGIYYAHDTTVSTATAIVSENVTFSQLEWTNGEGGESLTYPFAKPYPCLLRATAPVTVTMDRDATFEMLIIDAGEEITLDGTGAVTAETTIVKADFDVSSAAAALGAVSVAEGQILTVTYNKESQPYTSLNAPEGALRVANDVALEFTTDFLTGAGTWIVGEGTTTTLPGGQRNDANVLLKVEGTLDVNGTYDAIFKGVTLADGGVWTNTGTPPNNVHEKKQYANVTLEGGTATISGNSFGSIALGYAAQTMYLNGGTLDIAMASDHTFHIASANILKSAAEPTAEAGTLQVSSGAVKFFSDKNTEPFAETTTLRMVDGRAIFADRNYTMGALTGTGGVVEVVHKTLTVGALNTDSTYAGTVAGSGAIAKVGSGTLTLSGNNTDADVTLRVHGGRAALANNYAGPVTVDAGAELVIEPGATLPSSISGAGNICIKGVTCDVNQVNLTGTLTVEAGAIVTVTPERLAAFSRVIVDETSTIKIPSSMSVLISGEGIQIPIADATSSLDGSLLLVLPTGEEVAASYADGMITATNSANPTVTGSVWWWDYEFNGSVASIGSDTTTLTLEGNAATYAITDGDNQELYLQKTPWRAAPFSSQKTFSAVMYSQFGDYDNSVLVGFGSMNGNWDYNHSVIALTTGADAKNGELQLVLIDGARRLVTPLADNVIVPTATTVKHLYGLTVRIADGKTAMNLYVDGTLRKTVTLDRELYLADGFQLGSLHGGIYEDETELNKYPASGNAGTVDFLRVSKEILSASAMRALAGAYPFVAEGVTTQRTVSGASAQWVAENTWVQTAPDAEAVLKTAPDAGDDVTVTATSDTQMTLNLDESIAYESLTVVGSGTVTFVADGDAAINVAESAIETDTVIPYGAICVDAVSVADNTTLTFDFSDYDFTPIYKDQSLPLTGIAAMGANAAVEVILPETYPEWIASTACVYNTVTQSYELRVTLVEGDYIGTITEDCVWSAISWKKGEIDIPLPFRAMREVPVVLTAEQDVTVALERNIKFFNLTIQGARIAWTGNYTVTMLAEDLTTTTPLAIDSGITLDFTGKQHGSVSKKIEGTGTIKIALVRNLDFTGLYFTGFAGRTYVTHGHLCVTAGNLGSVLQTAHNVNLYLTSTVTDSNLSFITDGSTFYWIHRPYTTTGTLRGNRAIVARSTTLTVSSVLLNSLEVRSGLTVNPGENGEESRVARLSGGGTLRIASGTMNLVGANGDHGGTIYVDEGATLYNGSTHTIPLTTGRIVNNGQVIINSGYLPPISGAGDLTINNTVHLRVPITLTGTTTISQSATAILETVTEGGTFYGQTPGVSGGKLAVLGTLNTTKAPLVLGANTSLASSGSIVGDLTLDNGGTLDLSLGTIRVTGGVNLPATGTVSVTNIADGEVVALTYTGPAPLYPGRIFLADGYTAHASMAEGVTSITFTATTDQEVFTYTVEGDEVTLTGCQTNCPADVVIPARVDGRFVTSIAANAFAGRTGVTSIVLPSTVTSIGANAFAGCTDLTSVKIPAGVTSIGSGAFAGCTNLYRDENGVQYESAEKVVLIDAPTTLSGEFVVPDSVRFITEEAFSGCAALTRVTIPETVLSIGEGAFDFCSLLKIEVAAANTGYASQDGALFNKELTQLMRGPGATAEYAVPADVQMIEPYAFLDCTALTAVTIPASVTEIGASAFEGCTALETVAFLSTPPETLGEGAFPATQGTYLYELISDWQAEMVDGKWNNLTMTCSNPPSFSVTLTAVGGGEVSGAGEYKFEEEVTVTAIVPEGYVFCGWSTEPSVVTTSYTFVMPNEPVSLTAYFALQSVIEHHITAHKLMTKEDAIQSALDADEVFTADEMKEMAFGAPVVEVGADAIEISISLQTAESLDAWQAMALEGATLEVDQEAGMVRVRVPKGDKKGAFYKFVVPTDQTK